MPQFDISPFIQTTEIFDVQQIQSLDIRGPEFKEFLVILTQATNNIALALNDKTHGFYSLQHYPCGKQLFPVIPTGNNRGLARSTYFIPALPNAAGVSVTAHNIPWTNETFILSSTCQANDPDAVFPATTSFPIPAVASGGTGVVGFWLDNTNINIEVAADTSMFSAIVVIEYTT